MRVAGRTSGRKLEQPRVLRNQKRVLGSRPSGLFVSRLTPELQETMVKHVATGASIETAAAAAGVTLKTLRQWLIRGRDALMADDIPDSEIIYANLAYDVDGVLARFEVEELERIARHGDYDWRAAAWKLEHIFPAKYGRRSTVEIGNKNGEAFRIDAGPLDSVALTHLKELRDKLVQVRGALPAGQEDRIVEGEFVEVPVDASGAEAA